VGEVAYGNMAAAIVAGMPGQEPLVYLVDDSRLFVEAEIDESDAFRVRPGQSTRIRLGSVDRRTLSGHVVALSATVSTKEGESRTAEVKVELLGVASRDPASPGSPPYPPSPELPNVLVGMSADVEILVDRAEAVVRVPTAVVLERGEESYVFVVMDGRLSRRTIQVGLGNWETTEVRSGLEAGDLVVLPADLGDLRDGAHVRVIEKEPLP
jgi:HlyD family secretion protein